MADRREWTTEPCRNCGDGSPGSFCPACGQRKGEVRVSLRRMLADVLEDQLSIDSTLPRTLIAILFRPGHLTNEYLVGRIVHWIPPFRLYLAASVLFFLALSIGNRAGELRTMLTASGDTVSLDAGSRVPVGVAVDSLLAGPGDATSGAGDEVNEDATQEPPAQSRSFGITIEPAAPDDDRPWTERLIVRTGLPALDALVRSRVETLGGLPGDEAARRILAELGNRVPTAMFVLLPVFALLLKLLYFRSGRYYVEHFVFALHYHAFAFLGFTLLLVLGSTPVAPILSLWLFAYLWLALKRVYGQGVPGTFLKWVLLTWAYSLVLLVGLLLTLVVAVIML